MASATVPSASHRKEGRRRPLAESWRLLALVALAAVAAAAFVAHRYWPFEPKLVIEDLQEASDSRVTVRAFHRTYFPGPGCVLEGVVFTHGRVAEPLITIERLTIRTGYLRILSRHINTIEAEGLRVFIPAFGTGQSLHTQSSTITIGGIVANGATVEFASREQGKPPLRFDVHEASIRDVGWGGPLTYRVKVHNPEPPGEVTAAGKFGVWNENDPGQTPISGDYKFENADLGVYGGIGGTLSSVGKFNGKLGHIDISGTTDTPDFEVRSGHHPVRLTTEFSAYVDGTNGDTFLHRVEAHFGKTHVVAQGSVAKSKDGKGKTALLSLVSDGGRIEDILGLFVKAPRSPMSGAIKLRANVEIPPGEPRFLEKIRLKGAFGIGAGEFSKASTQEAVNKLSAGARGEKDPDDPETVLTDLTGQVALDHGVATFTELSFGIPGAAARMHGTYGLIDHKIDLHGQMDVLTKMSNTVSGPKAFLLKVMDPFFKKRKKGEILPVRISGVYEKPTFGLDLNDKKAQVPLPRKPPPGRDNYAPFG